MFTNRKGDWLPAFGTFKDIGRALTVRPFRPACSRGNGVAIGADRYGDAELITPCSPRVLERDGAGLLLLIFIEDDWIENIYLSSLYQAGNICSRCTHDDDG